MSSFSIADSTPRNSPPNPLLTPRPNLSDLPRQIEQDLSALGGVRAPEELWVRVQSELAGTHARPRGGLLAGVFGGRRIAVAAAALILGGLAILVQSDGGAEPAENPVVLASRTPEAIRATFRARAVFEDVAPAEMSEFARGLAVSLGGLMVEDDV